jgi:hypothetical protein
MSIMDEAHLSFFIDGYLGGHAPEFEQIDFLPIFFQDAMGWVGQANEGQVMFLPVAGKGLFILGPENQNNRLLSHELIIIEAQLRHVPLAEGSEKTAIEDQQHILAALKI